MENRINSQDQLQALKFQSTNTAPHPARAGRKTAGRRQRIPSKPDSLVNEQNQTDRFITPHRVTNQPVKPATQQQAEEAK
jgi:hypothetical protein